MNAESVQRDQIAAYQQPFTEVLAEALIHFDRSSAGCASATVENQKTPSEAQHATS